MLKISALVGALCLLAGCTSVYPTYTASGSSGYRLICGGLFGDGDLGSCYQKAGEMCESKGYRVLQTSVGSLIVECRDTADVQAEGVMR